MKQALRSLTGHQSAQASVADGKLILSFPHALTPVVWQMDLNEVKSSALEVVEDEKTKRFILVSKISDTKIVEIAPFDNREDAVDGLMAAAKALEGAQGQIRGTANTAEQHPQLYVQNGTQHKRSWLPLLLLLFTVLVIFTVWASLSARIQNTHFETLGTTSSASQNTQRAAEPGVAISADEFLRQP